MKRIEDMSPARFGLLVAGCFLTATSFAWSACGPRAPQIDPFPRETVVPMTAAPAVETEVEP